MNGDKIMGEKKLWHQHYPEEIPVSVSYDSKPLQAYLVESAELYGEKKALHFMGKDITFSQLYEESKRMAHYMQRLGIEKGDRVAIMLPNRDRKSTRLNSSHVASSYAVF